MQLMINCSLVRIVYRNSISWQTPLKSAVVAILSLDHGLA